MLSQEIEAAYPGDEDPLEADWDEEVPEQPEHWVSGLLIRLNAGCFKWFEMFCASLCLSVSLQQDEPHPKRPAQNVNARRNFKRIRNRHGVRLKRTPNNGNELFYVVYTHDHSVEFILGNFVKLHHRNSLKYSAGLPGTRWWGTGKKSSSLMSTSPSFEHELHSVIYVKFHCSVLISFSLIISPFTHQRLEGTLDSIAFSLRPLHARLISFICRTNMDGRHQQSPSLWPDNILFLSSINSSKIITTWLYSS